MKELIKITTNENGHQLVNARELHDFLENRRQFTDWIKQRIEQYGFVENEDFSISQICENGGRPKNEYAITVEMAKELSMVENNERGKEARGYFIKCEKVAKENIFNTAQLSPELQMFNQMFKAIANNELEQKKIKASIEETKEEIQGIRDAITLNPNQWRKDTATLINKIANKIGGFEYIRNVREESYKILNETYAVDVNRRLQNKKKNMALEGASKSKINNINPLDVIAEDKKLINGYINIVTKLAIKHGVA
ncbi:antA/AntB antirepressor family protein [Clostridium sp. LP20]|uniref:antA/AntB antirepressor family protein n=1 Tax=Clostridium sp. LP20 TaxID=3418665 RepID=UPI003EE5E043